MISKRRVKTFLRQMSFKQVKGSSTWTREEVHCYFGRGNGKSTFSMYERGKVDGFMNYVKYNLDEMTLDQVVSYMSNIESMKQEIRKIQLKNILEL